MSSPVRADPSTYVNQYGSSTAAADKALAQATQNYVKTDTAEQAEAEAFLNRQVADETEAARRAESDAAKARAEEASGAAGADTASQPEKASSQEQKTDVFQSVYARAVNKAGYLKYLEKV